jgi:hypothetical protein
LFDRQQEFEDEYVHARPELLRVFWLTYDKEIVEFSSWFASFLSKLDEFIADERESLTSLFGSDRMPRLLSSMIEGTLAPMAGSMAERLLSSTTPLTALEAFDNLSEFARTTVATLEGGDSHQLFCVLSAVFGGFILYMDSYPDIESDFLRRECAVIISKVNFEDSDSLFGEVARPTSASRMSQTPSLDNSDPVAVCMTFGEKLVDAVEAVTNPIMQSSKRTVKFMAGLKVKPSIKAVAVAVCSIVQQLTYKVDELRTATGHPPEKSSIAARPPSAALLASSSSSANLATSEASSQVQPVHPVAVHAHSWAKKLESSDLGGRELIPAALLALQSAGRMSKHIRELEILALELFTELAPLLFKDSVADRYYRNMPAMSSPSPALPTSFSGGPTASVCGLYASQLLQNNPSASLELKSFLSAVTSHHVAQSAFASVASPLSKYKASCGALLFDLCCCAPDKLLLDLRNEDVWASKTASADEDGLLPQQLFTQVCSTLLWSSIRTRPFTVLLMFPGGRAPVVCVPRIGVLCFK